MGAEAPSVGTIAVRGRSVMTHIRLIKLCLAGAALLIILLLPHFVSATGMHLAMVGLMGAISALGLNIFFGYCGQINFGVAGFLAIGGYGVALLERYTTIPYFISLIISVVASGLIAFFAGLALLRLREYMLALGTLAFGMAVYEAVAKGFTTVTKGEDGINLSRLGVFGIPAGDTFFYYLFLFVTVLCWWISHALRNSRAGRAMLAISQNELAATSFGVNINKYIMQAFLVSNMMIAAGGGLFVKWMSWCSPEYFSMMTTISVVLAVVAGGIGSTFGVIIGGIVMFILREVLVPLALYDMLAYGIILCLFLLFMPRGIGGGIAFINNLFRKG
jgi:branched-chain amino acid transport system permease protein